MQEVVGVKLVAETRMIRATPCVRQMGAGPIALSELMRAPPRPASAHAGDVMLNPVCSRNSQLVQRRLMLQYGMGVLLAGPACAADMSMEFRAPTRSMPSVSDIYASYSYASPKDVLPFVLDYAAVGDAEAVLMAIDQFSAAFPMYKIGPEKGSILDALVIAVQPMLAVELGSFIGYSAVRIARLLPPGGRLVCVEANPECVAAMEGVLRHAGLRDRVIIEQGLADGVVPRLRKQYGQAQLLFEDHCKPCYLPDLRVAEASGLLPPGGWTIADNVLVPNPLPDLIDHLRDPEAYRSLLVRAKYEYEQVWNPDWTPEKLDGMTIAVRTAGLEESAREQAQAQLEALCRQLGSCCSPIVSDTAVI